MPLNSPQIIALAFAIATAATGCASRTTTADPGLAAEARALQLLSREVPAWSAENACFSCHNNGDAARALMLAARLGHKTPKSSLADTAAWLSRPATWDDNKGDPGFSDHRLANLQFALALVTATDHGLLDEPSAVQEAARRVARDQAADGSWPIDPHNRAGSPATYGSALATALAIRILRTLPTELEPARQRAFKWLSGEPVGAVPSAAGMLFAKITARETEAVDYLHRTQNGDGGWGPYPDSPSEAFDTALALLALAEVDSAPSKSAILRGRQFLVAWQNPDGSWPATTRPSGGESYAQQMSTTGWATLALLKTRTRK